MNNLVTLKEIWIITIINTIVSCYNVDLIDNGPIVKGGNITFTALLYYDGHLASGSFKYFWTDNAVPSHSTEVSSESAMDIWSVSYNESIYPAGRYVAQVTVCKNIFVYCYTIASNRVEFYINETLNGEIHLIQKNQTRNSIYVSNADPVVHNVSIKLTDAEFIKKAPTVLTYWFIDCTYQGFRRDFQFVYNYTEPEQEHLVEALVIADFTPLPPPPTTTVPTTTTTTATTTTTTKPTTKPTATTPSTTTTKQTTTSVTKSTTASSTTIVPTVSPPVNGTTVKSLRKRAVNLDLVKNDTDSKILHINSVLSSYNGSFPYICNGTKVATDPKKTYGYFYKRVKVRVPVTKVNVTGNNWLQHGDLLTLNVKCHSSKNLKYCVLYERGIYNVSGKEICPYYHELEKCEFTIQRYFIESMEHTVVIIIENEVSKVVTPVAVTVYKVKKQAQLSVIVVPVAFSLVAVVLIVFGVAYYIQNRSRFIVEVADFNFGQNYSDMEYKTFKERLRDSIANAFFSRGPSPGSSEVPVWPPGRKYGSMTS